MSVTREESIYAPVMARLRQVEQMTELEKLFTLELPGARAWTMSRASSWRYRSLASVRRRSLSAPPPAGATAILSYVCGVWAM